MTPAFHFILWLGFAAVTCGQTLEVLHSFDNTNGANPQAGLVQGSDGSFYGTTHFGGAYGKGAVFRIRGDGSFAALASFDGTNGSYPVAGLVQASDGGFYGTTASGGAAGYGSVFRLDTNGILTTLVSFNLTNGSFPQGELLPAADGSFYGTTLQGGISNSGTIFQLTTNGVLTTLYCFTSGTNGYQPNGGLVLAADNCLYGTTFGGGGTVFRSTTNGELTTIVRFDGSNGSYPRTGLAAGADGQLYGTTSSGGANSIGTLFKTKTGGELTTLAVFSLNTGYQCGPLTQQIDDRFYGAMAGGSANYGAVFQLLTNGLMTTLVGFAATNNGPRQPQCRLLQGSDGNLYGTSYHGGNYNHGGTSDSSYGTVFRIVLPVMLKARLLGTDLVLSWPTNAPGFKLQSAQELRASTSWAEVTNAPAVVGADFVVTNRSANGSHFYRLQK